jgi:hypothetical protein
MLTFEEFNTVNENLEGNFKEVSGELDSLFAKHGYLVNQYWNNGAREDEIWKEYIEDDKGERKNFFDKKAFRILLSKEKDGYRLACWNMRKDKHADYKTTTLEEIEKEIQK